MSDGLLDQDTRAMGTLVQHGRARHALHLRIHARSRMHGERPVQWDCSIRLAARCIQRCRWGLRSVITPRMGSASTAMQ